MVEEPFREHGDSLAVANVVHGVPCLQEEPDEAA